MNLPPAVKKHFGFDPATNPFADTPDGPEAIFRWPAFDVAVEKIVEAVLTHRFLVVCGNYCSSKSTAWMLAREALLEHRRYNVLIAQPCGLDPRGYDEGTVYRAIVHDVGDGQRMRHAREDRAAQCREILQRHVDSGGERQHRAAFVVNDAHACRSDYLLICKRLWDELHGYTRLVAVVLIGQASLYQSVERIGEIKARRELLVLPGLGDKIADYVRFEAGRCGVDADAIFTPDAYDALKALRSDRRFESGDHPLGVSNAVIRALREAKKIGQKKVDAELVGIALRTGDDDGASAGGARRGPRLAAP